jgi:SNF2 family DNA or RNA helicase
MNMQVLSKQRALNMQDEQDAIRRKEEEQLDTGTSKVAAAAPTRMTKTLHITKMLRGVVLDMDKPWDPEDNVRYVVKWKGLPYSEMTWEYWRDIKRDAVDEAEDFWYRQQAPDPNDPALYPVHPHMQLFRKLQESATYGISSRDRPVADLEGLQRANSLSIGDDDDNDNNPGFRLRSYQLEGVNWLLFNWWNKRSCILAGTFLVSSLAT